jgi:hypothetical protein
MAQIQPALGASAKMTGKVVSFPLIASLLLLKPIVDAICAFVLVFGLVAASLVPPATAHRVRLISSRKIFVRAAARVSP